MIIGKGGGFIKQIKEESGAYIQISQKAKDQALQERCITVIGDMECNRKACSMILSKIAEDPQSGSCLNVSYADVTGPVANFNPTGSPYAHNGSNPGGGGGSNGAGGGSSAGGSGGSGAVGLGSNSGGYSPVHNGNGSSSGSNPYGVANLGAGVNCQLSLSIGLGVGSPPNTAMLNQMVDHLRSSLRSAGYPEHSATEVIKFVICPNDDLSYKLIYSKFTETNT